MASRNRLQKGLTFTEVLVSVAILAITMAGIISLWQVSLSLNERQSDETLAYYLTRKTVEEIKLGGFDGPAEGTTIYYYDAEGVGVSGTGATRPADDALRDVTIKVFRVKGDLELNRISTYLARSGV
jgi:prepilin-type N-terminal cleavage/methylation domain-containing protein